MEGANLTIGQLEELYFQLSAAYGSPHSDNAETIRMCALKLRAAITTDGQTPESLLAKIKALRQHSTGQYKTKMSSQVDDRYWMKQLHQPVRAKFFTPDEPVL